MALLRAEKISKRFGGVIALDQVDFAIEEAEVIGLVGDNGAGKSTFVKILAGAYPDYSGDIYFQEKKLRVRNPHEARWHGIDIVYQDLALADNINIPGNVFLGRELSRSLFGKVPFPKLLDNTKMKRESEKLLDSLEIDLEDLNVNVENLSGGQRKAVAIARSIYWRAKLVIMDEPTAALAVKEVGKVLKLVKDLKAKRVSIIFISHNLQEIFSIVDKIMVLRRGEVASFSRVQDTSLEIVIRQMVGQKA